MKTPLQTSILALAFALSTLCGVTQAAAAPTVSRSELSAQIEDRITRVPEFGFIRKEAEALGIKAYLFGGTAAGYAHYVKWDLLREKGNKRFQPDRFDYDYTNIYRSTQDLDIVVDGTEAQARALQKRLTEVFPHFQGGKAVWEVRLLRQDMGDKQALFYNPDFLNQHTDSNSTGMIEITKPVHGESPVHDLRDWGSREPNFLKDVADGEIHYYYSPLHETTSFYKEGRNPPILSVVRYLTKAFQYELELRPEDLDRIKKVIDDFHPYGPEMQDSYVRHWLLDKENGRKLIKNAVNIEYAWDTLEKLGLRRKLIAIENNPQEMDSLAWWMSKEPLRSFPVGIVPKTGDPSTYPTAQELGIDVVAHETNSFSAYESITRAHTGDPNVLISRNNFNGEAAAFGDGFYTKIGREGAGHTGLTIRFKVDPNARLGIDFSVTKTAHDAEYVIFRNKNAIRVIPESIQGNLPDLFEMLGSGVDVPYSDFGILERFKRRVSHQGHILDAKDQARIVAVARKEFQKASPNPLIEKMWFELPFSSDYPDILNAYLKSEENVLKFAEKYMNQPRWRRPEILDAIISNKKTASAIVEKIFAAAARTWKPNPGTVERYIKTGGANKEVAARLLSTPGWSAHPELVKEILQKGDADAEIIKYVLSNPEWVSHPEIVESLMQRRGLRRPIVEYVLSAPGWSAHPEIVKTLLRDGELDREIVEHVLKNPEWASHPEFAELIIERGTQVGRLFRDQNGRETHWASRKKLVEKALQSAGLTEDGLLAILATTAGAAHPELVQKLLDRGDSALSVGRSILMNPAWKDHPEFVEQLFDGPQSFVAIELMRQAPHWWSHPKLIQKLVYNSDNGHHGMFETGWIDTQILSSDGVRNNPILKELCHGQKITYDNLREAFRRGATVDSPQRNWEKNPEILIQAIKGGKDYHFIFGEVLRQPYWLEHPEIIEELVKLNDPKIDYELGHLFLAEIWKKQPRILALCKGKVSLENLRKALNRKPLFDCSDLYQRLFSPKQK